MQIRGKGRTVEQNSIHDAAFQFIANAFRAGEQGI
jgi:hypothetical protein